MSDVAVWTIHFVDDEPPKRVTWPADVTYEEPLWVSINHRAGASPYGRITVRHRIPAGRVRLIEEAMSQ